LSLKTKNIINVIHAYAEYNFIKYIFFFIRISLILVDVFSALEHAHPDELIA